MSDGNEPGRHRDRHRRGRNRGGSASTGAGQRDARGGKEAQPARGGRDGRAAPADRNARQSEGRRDGRSDNRQGRPERDTKAAIEELNLPRSGRDSHAPQRDAQAGRREKREDLPPLPKLPTPLCPRCNLPIQDITSALADKTSGEAVHFDCVLKFLQDAENPGPNEKIGYIGNGRFAVMTFDNPQDQRNFKIVRIIEWESREARAEWRMDIAGRFSQIK